MASFTIIPKVDETQEFLEIANDFSNPLELVREAISNAFDARAKSITISFTVEKEFGERILYIDISDDGHGMNRDGLQSFFDLGNSLRRDDETTIGEKGHGTKVYFNSASIDVYTTRDGHTFNAKMHDPFRKLFNREIPVVEVADVIPPHSSSGTQIKIRGYNNNRRELFTHERLKDTVFCIEGNKTKQGYNKMLKRQGYKAPEGAYTVQERYGLWLCKDFIPIQRKNEWLVFKGSEYTKFHAFFNCQDFRLTANRGSVDNTPSEIMSDVKDAVLGIYNEIVQGDAWREIEWLESEAEGYQTAERERKDFQWRIAKANKANVCEYKGTMLVEPQREHGVFALFLKLDMVAPDLFPFAIVDYDTHSGIDVVAKGDKTTPIQNAKLFYVEFKLWLTQQFNHSFENLFSIVCWDTEVKHDESMVDVNGEARKMQILGAEGNGDYTRYFLDHPKKAHKIEVFVLKDYLRQKLGLEFRPRAAIASTR